MLACQVIRLEPTPVQGGLFFRHAVAARIARNDLIVLWKDEGRRLPGFRYTLAELRPRLNAVKDADRPWFRELSQNAVKGGYIDAQDAIKRYYDKQGRRPRCHGKGRRLRFRADNGPGTVKVDGNRLILPAKMGGRVKLAEPLRWPGAAIRECRISERGGHWYASIRQEITPEMYGGRCGAGQIGIDLGLSTFVTIAWQDGSIEAVDAPQPLKRSLRALRRSSRKLSRRKQGGQNWRKAKAELSRRHCRMANIRKDFLHKLSHRLTANAEVIVTEDISIKAWQRRWGRKTSDLAPGEFRRQLEYKAQWRGGKLVKADWNYPSTQLCPACGEKTGPKTLDIRRWACAGCGAIHGRDAAAAQNLRDWPGATGLQATESVVRPATAGSRRRSGNQPARSLTTARQISAG